MLGQMKNIQRDFMIDIQKEVIALLSSVIESSMSRMGALFWLEGNDYDALELTRKPKESVTNYIYLNIQRWKIKLKSQ